VAILAILGGAWSVHAEHFVDLITIVLTHVPMCYPKIYEIANRSWGKKETYLDGN
jgi:hypothetical protein